MLHLILFNKYFKCWVKLYRTKLSNNTSIQRFRTGGKGKSKNENCEIEASTEKVHSIHNLKTYMQHKD